MGDPQDDQAVVLSIAFHAMTCIAGFGLEEYVHDMPYVSGLDVHLHQAPSPTYTAAQVLSDTGVQSSLISGYCTDIKWFIGCRKRCLMTGKRLKDWWP